VTKSSGGKRPAKKKVAPRTKAKARKPAAIAEAKTIAVEEKHAAKKPVRNYLRHARKRISVDFDDIVEAMSKKSIEGSLPHVKYLFEIGGVKEEIARQGEGKREPSLAQLLMAELKKKQREARPDPETGGPSSDEDEAGADAADAGAGMDERGEDCGVGEQ
jgi:hypothetical protein